MNSARKLFLVAGLASAVLASPAQAQVRELPRAKAESVGMSTERLARISATLAADVDSRKIPGAVVLVARHGKVVLYEAFGKLFMMQSPRQRVYYRALMHDMVYAAVMK